MFRRKVIGTVKTHFVLKLFPKFMPFVR